MPTYDVACSECGFTGLQEIKLTDVDSWDFLAKCPSCSSSNAGAFKRVIKKAPASAITGSQAPKKTLSNADKETMLHKNLKHRDGDKIAAAVETVKKGTFEGF